MSLENSLTPIKLDDFIINKDIAQKIKLFDWDNINNLIVSGLNNAGKQTLVNAYLNYLFDCNINDTKKMSYYQLKIGNNTVDINYISTSYHIELNLYEYGLYDKSIISDFIKDIILFKSITQFKYKIIVFNHFDLVSQLAQTSLRKLIEQSMETCRFIFIAESTSKLEKSIMSRCYNIRLPIPSKNILTNYLEVISKQKFNFSKSVKDKILNTCGNDLFKLNNIIICTSNDTKFNYNKLDNINKDLLKIYKLIEKQNLSSILEIRSICYNLLLLNFNPKEIFKNIVEHFLKEKNLSLTTKLELTSFAADVEFKMVNIEHDIICIEYLILKVKKILLTK